jgi:hypothetical protein
MPGGDIRDGGQEDRMIRGETSCPVRRDFRPAKNKSLSSNLGGDFEETNSITGTADPLN